MQEFLENFGKNLVARNLVNFLNMFSGNIRVKKKNKSRMDFFGGGGGIFTGENFGVEMEFSEGGVLTYQHRKANPIDKRSSRKRTSFRKFTMFQIRKVKNEIL